MKSEMPTGRPNSETPGFPWAVGRAGCVGGEIEGHPQISGPRD